MKEFESMKIIDKKSLRNSRRRILTIVNETMGTKWEQNVGESNVYVIINYFSRKAYIYSVQ